MPTIQINEIQMDKMLMFREKLDEEAIERYQKRYESELFMPPIIVYRVPNKGCLLVDGFHRVTAAKKAGLKTINADVKNGSYDDAVLAAATANVKHGMPLSQEERKKVVKVFLKMHPERTNRWIAEDVGVSVHNVQKIREQLESSGVQIAHLDKLQGRDGKWYPKKRYNKRKLHKIEDPPAVSRIKIRDDVLPKEWAPDFQKKELQQNQLMTLVNEGCERIDESKVKDKLSKAIAHFINLTYEEANWDDEIYRDFFVFGGRSFSIAIRQKKEKRLNRRLHRDNIFEVLRR